MDPTTYTGKHPLTADIDQMPDTPYRGFHHRRAHSDTTFRFDDLLLFDPSDLDLASLDLPTPTPPRGVPMNVDSSDDSTCKPPKPNHLRSLSVDSDFFDGFDAVEEKFGGKGVGGGGGVGEKRGNHRHSNSIDGSTATSFDAESGLLFDSGKKATDADRLAELALIDPKRAKRILANRQSAARSKERKVRYTNELERKVQTLQSEATTLSAQVTVLQRDTTGLTTENKELKLRLQALEQQAHLRDALNEALREEVQRLRIAAGQVPAANGNLYNQPAPLQFASNQPALQQFGGIQQNHQYQQQQQQLQVSQSSVNNQVHPHASFSNYGQKV